MARHHDRRRQRRAITGAQAEIATSAQPMRAWWRALRRRHVRVLLTHPHHYGTALGLTLFFLSIGKVGDAAVTAAWAYAIIDNISSAAEG